MSKSTQEQNAPVWFGGLFIAAGMFIVLLAVGVVPSDPASLHAPPWVLATAGMVFVLGGVMSLSQQAKRWVNELLAIAMTGSLASISSWVAFGPGEREFSSSVTLGPLSFGGPESVSLGRAVFGLGSIVLWALVLLLVYRCVGALKSAR